MTDENFKLLLAEFDAKKLMNEQYASFKAGDYVQSSNEEDRASSKAYLRDAAMWAEARNPLLKFNNNVQ